jgi:plastocyanin
VSVRRNVSARTAAYLVALAATAACGLPAALGGQSPVVAPTVVALDGPPAQSQIAGVVPSATALFAMPSAPANGAPAAPTQSGPLTTGASALAPLAPNTSNLGPAPTAPPAPTLIPAAAAAATANAATAVAAISKAVATATAVPTQQILIQGFAFTPATITVQPGTTIVWRNMDPGAHHVSGSDFDSGQVIGGEYWAAQFLRPGTFDYMCSIHPTMRGRIVVSPTTGAERFSS